jgi:hypothetical protein
MGRESCFLLSHIQGLIAVKLGAIIAAVFMWRAMIRAVFGALFIPDHH